MRIDAFQPANEFKSKMDEWIETFRSSKPAEDRNVSLYPEIPKGRRKRK